MPIVFCPACDRHLYVDKREIDECPTCSAPLAETEETIRKRIVHLEPVREGTDIVLELPAGKSEVRMNGEYREKAKEGRL